MCEWLMCAFNQSCEGSGLFAGAKSDAQGTKLQRYIMTYPCDRQEKLGAHVECDLFVGCIIQLQCDHVAFEAHTKNIVAKPGDFTRFHVICNKLHTL